MSKTLKKSLILLLGAALIITLALKLLWPANWVVNAPMLQFLTGIGGQSVTDQKLQARVSLPPGFTINTFADNLGHARELLLLPNGDLLLSAPREGTITRLLVDRNRDGRADGIERVLGDLNYPSGIDYHQGMLYIGETDAVIRVPYDLDSGQVDQKDLKRIITGLPGGGNHYTRTVKIGPDQHLYVTVGSSCNVCLEKDSRRATMLRYKLDGSGEQIFASGLRNTVGFDWQPGTGALYGVDNGRDLLGDNFPPEELNHIIEGGFYGWPYLNGDNVKDPDYGDRRDPRIKNALQPTHTFAAHVAPLGITFLTASDTPADYKNAALVTHHGSWNRSQKIGYQMVSLHWQANGSIVERPFLTGFLQNEAVFGRPVDVVQAPDGTLFVSDDFTSAVYRITLPP